MARIPTRATSRELPAGPDQLPSVRLTAAPNARDLGYSNQVPNEGARRDMSSAMDSLSNALARIQQRKDNTQVLAILGEAQKESGIQQAQLLSKKGALAEGITDQAEKWFKDQHAEFSGRLENDRQKRAFDEQWQRLKVNSVVSVSRHQEQQANVALEQAANSAVAGAVELAAANPTDPEALADYRSQVLVASQNAAAAKGFKSDSPGAALIQLDNLSALHDKVIGSLLQDDPGAAAEYLKQHGGEMNASTKQRVTKLVETTKRLRLAQKTADEYVGSGLTEPEAIAKARQKFDGEDERDVVAEIKTRFIETNAARERAQRAAADEAWKIVEQSGSLANVPPAVLEAMDGRDIAAIRRSIEQRAATLETRAAARESRAAAVESRAWTRDTRERTLLERKGHDRYEELRAMAVLDPEAFRKIDFRRENAVLNGTQIASLSTLRDKPPVKDFLTYEQQLSRATVNMDKKDKGAFQIDIDRKMEAATAAKGKELTQAERQDIIDRAQVDYKIDRPWLPDSKVKGFELNDQNRERAYLPDMPDLPKPAVQAVIAGVPKDKIQAIVAEFEKRGVALDAALILKQYQFENRKR